MNKQILTDPYSNIPSDVKSKIQTWLPRTEELFLVAINPNRGTMQYTINKLLKGLIDECRASGITDYSRVDDFVAIVNRRSAFSLSPDSTGLKAEVRNDGGGNAHVAPPPPQQPDVRPNPPKRGAKRSGSVPAKVKRVKG